MNNQTRNIPFLIIIFISLLIGLLIIGIFFSSWFIVNDDPIAILMKKTKTKEKPNHIINSDINSHGRD